MESQVIGRNKIIEEISGAAAYIKNKPITEPSQMPKPIEHYPMGDAWLERIKEYWWATHYEGVIPKDAIPMAALRDRLLSFGGQQVSMPYTEDDLESIMTRGQLWYGDRTRMIKGEMSQCHKNSCALWELNKNLLMIATGYALSDDGMWRQHSWLVHIKPRKNKIIETTTPRVAYFGFVMTEEEAYEFCEWNLW